MTGLALWLTTLTLRLSQEVGRKRLRRLLLALLLLDRKLALADQGPLVHPLAEPAGQCSEAQRRRHQRPVPLAFSPTGLNSDITSPSRLPMPPQAACDAWLLIWALLWASCVADWPIPRYWP